MQSSRSEELRIGWERMRTRRFHNIRAWQLADDLAFDVYEATRAYPSEERYGVVSQMRRASVSVAANIAEGSGRSSAREYLQFLAIAKGSLAEVRYYLHLSRRLRYLEETQHRQLDQLCDEASRVLYGLMCAVRGQKGSLVIPAPPTEA